MQVTVTFRHMESSDALRKYAEEKSERLVKFLNEPIEIHWVLSVEKIRHIADTTVVANGATIKAQSNTQDMYSSIDTVMDKLEKQVRKHKEKTKDHKNVSANVKYAEGAIAGAPVRSRIVKTVNQFLKPMSVEEAAEQMDVVSNDFLVFTDSVTSNVNVIYRLDDGEYGLIETRIK
ncbi:MAG TPA: ribosome-associated translation inhibitor RaiA [Thermodesulfobacteriota bacterium]|nr:ribosome-associated translation inhibitor RaiA [Thermodesulfobacteriota bacterium]